MVNDIKLPGKGEQSAGAAPDPDNEPSFTPPEVIAQEEDVIELAGKNKENPNKDKNPSKKPARLKALFAKLGAWWKARTKKQKIIIIVAGVLLVALLSYGIYALLDKPAPPTPKPVAKEEVKEEPPKTTEPSKLTGVEVPLAVNKLPVIGIMIENSPDARPQSGLHQAGVVFEAVAEGGITRFLALFLEGQPDYVGPIRSVRPYYIQWAMGFDAPIAHVGGSAEALARMRTEGLPDLDQSFNPNYFQRVSNRYAPHNVYTSIAKLLELSSNKNYISELLKPLERKPEAPAATPTARIINLAISSPLYNVQYTYEPASNSYLRSQGGAPHTDERSGTHIKPKVVIALLMNKGIAADRIHTTYGSTGTGTAWIFQNGTITDATWTKSGDKEQFKFTDGSGIAIGLNPGQTWISVVSVPSSVTFTP